MLFRSFWEGLEIPQPFEDVLLTGSSVNYNYTPTSDIDLHIVVDFSKFDSPDLLKKYFDEAKINWNRVHDLKLGKQNIEVYVQDVTDHPKYRGEYSLMNDKWLHKPSFENIDIPDEDIEEKAKIFKQQIDKLEKTGKDNPEKSIELIASSKPRTSACSFKPKARRSPLKCSAKSSSRTRTACPCACATWRTSAKARNRSSATHS